LEVEQWGNVFKVELEINQNWGNTGNEEPRRQLKKIRMNEKEISIMNKVVCKWGISKIGNLLDVSNVLYSVGKTLEFMNSKEEDCDYSKRKTRRGELRNRTLKKLDDEIKYNKRFASWAECELQRRREK
jgi:hypothetical protein